MHTTQQIGDAKGEPRPKALPFLTPWWWPVVEVELGPRMTACAAEHGSSPAITAQRVWAVLELMMNQSCHPDTLAMFFPEVTVSKDWKARETFMTALNHSPEAVLAQCALARLAGVVRECVIVPLFNPCLQHWNNHFQLVGMRIVGLTPVGRAIIALLRLNDAARLIDRQMLSDARLYPPLHLQEDPGMGSP